VRSTQDPRSGFAVTVLQARNISLQCGYNDQSVHSRKHQRRVHAARSRAVSNNLQSNYITCPYGTFSRASAQIFDEGLQKNKTPILLIVFNLFIKTFWGLNVLPPSDVRYSTKDVCSVGPFRHSLYHWTTKDILRGIFSSRRQGFELPADRTEHEAQCAKSRSCSSVNENPNSGQNM
jgi:hypothetical protein